MSQDDLILLACMGFIALPLAIVVVVVFCLVFFAKED